MNKEETIKHFNIPEEVLEEYHALGFCCEVQKVMGTWQYNDRDIERLGLIMTLHDVGFSNEEVALYMQLEAEGEETKQQRCKMLDKKRSSSLDEIHFKEKQLDRIDYLRQKIRNK